MMIEEKVKYDNEENHLAGQDHPELSSPIISRVKKNMSRFQDSPILQNLERGELYSGRYQMKEEVNTVLKEADHLAKRVMTVPVFLQTALSNMVEWFMYLMPRLEQQQARAAAIGESTTLNSTNHDTMNSHVQLLESILSTPPPKTPKRKLRERKSSRDNCTACTEYESMITQQQQLNSVLKSSIEQLYLMVQQLSDQIQWSGEQFQLRLDQMQQLHESKCKQYEEAMAREQMEHTKQLNQLKQLISKVTSQQSMVIRQEHSELKGEMKKWIEPMKCKIDHLSKVVNQQPKHNKYTADSSSSGGARKDKDQRKHELDQIQKSISRIEHQLRQSEKISLKEARSKQVEPEAGDDDTSMSTTVSLTRRQERKKDLGQPKQKQEHFDGKKKSRHPISTLHLKRLFVTFFVLLLALLTSTHFSR